MTDEFDSQITLEERIRQLFAHHRIERAHFVGGGLVGDLIALCTAAPDLFASLTLVCPLSIPMTLSRDLPMPFCIVSGDHGRAADLIDRALSTVADPRRVVLKDYDPLGWTDAALERTEEILRGLTSFLASVDREVELAATESSDPGGMVAELAYRSSGAGRPLVLFPLGLAPSQWQPLRRARRLRVLPLHELPQGKWQRACGELARRSRRLLSCHRE